MPPPGESLFDEPPGDCHIKFGYLKSNDTFTVKIATGFWENPARGLPSSNSHSSRQDSGFLHTAISKLPHRKQQAHPCILLGQVLTYIGSNSADLSVIPTQ